MIVAGQGEQDELLDRTANTSAKASRQLSLRIQILDRISNIFLSQTNDCVRWNIKVYDTARPNYCIRADSARTNYNCAARNPSPVLYCDTTVQSLTSYLSRRALFPEIVGSSQ
jgi:hypothetical protein